MPLSGRGHPCPPSSNPQPLRNTMNARSRRFPSALVAGAVLLASQPVPAQLLVYDGFDAGAGSHLPGTSGGFGWSGPWTTGLFVDGFPMVPGSLVPPAPGVQVSGGSVIQPLGGPGQPISHFWSIRSIDPIPIPLGGDLWMSAILSTSSGTLDGSLVRAGFEFQDPSFGEAVTLSTYAPGLAGDPLRWSLNGSLGMGPVVTPGEPALLVGHLTRIGNVAYAFDFHVNPPTGPGAAAPTTPAASFVWGGDYDTLYRVSLSAHHEGLVAGFDEIRIGRSFASVTSAISAVPEPGVTSVVTALALAAAAAGTRRFRILRTPAAIRYGRGRTAPGGPGQTP